MLSPNIYYLKKHQETIVRLLPNVDKPSNFFHTNKINFGKRHVVFRHYVFAKIKNKYTVFYTGRKIHDFIKKNLVEGFNPFDLTKDVALKITFKKLKQPLTFGNVVMHYTTDLSFVHDNSYIIWDGTENDKERVLKYLKNKHFTLEEMANIKRSYNSVQEFFQYG